MAVVLDLPVVLQGEAECGPASLAIVARFHGQALSAGQLARLANTTPLGTDHADLVAGARKAGATVHAQDRGTLDELAALVARRTPPIVGWWSMAEGDRRFDPAWSLDERRAYDCGHFSVVAGVTEREVLLVDPQDDGTGAPVGLIGLPRADFLAVWYDTDTPAYVPVERWYMVASWPPRGRV